MPTPLERKLTPADRVDARPFHEPQGRAGVSPASVGNADGTESLALARALGRRDACPTLGAFHGSWSQCMRKSERRLSMNRSAELQLRQVRRRKKTLIAPGWSPALQFRGSWSQCMRKCSTIPSQIAQRAVSL